MGGFGLLRGRRLRAAGLAVVAATMLPGCWWQLGGGPGNERFNGIEAGLTVDNVVTLGEQWRTPVEGNLSEPIVAGSRLYTTVTKQSSGAGDPEVLAVRAFDTSTGMQVWERSLIPAGAAVTESVVLIDDTLWVPYWHGDLPGCGNGGIARLDPADGTVLGVIETGIVVTPVVAAGPVIAFGSMCGWEATLTVLDRDDLELLWTGNLPLTAGPNTPTFGHGKIFVGGNGGLVAFDAGGCGSSTCAPVWTLDQTFSLQGHRPVVGPDGQVFVIADEPGFRVDVLAVDAADGTVRWRTPADYSIWGGRQGLAAANGNLYVAAPLPDPDDELQAIGGTLDVYSAAGCGGALVCPPAWSVPLGVTPPSTAPTVAGGVVYVGIVDRPEVAPAVVAADAAGCGEAICTELTRVSMLRPDEPPGPRASGPVAMSVAHGRVWLTTYPDRFVALMDLVSLGPT